MTRAMVMAAARDLRLTNVPYPSMPPDGAVVEVLANGICGSDWALFSGEQTRPGGKPAAFPMIPGHEPVARVREISSSARERWGVEVGDRIVIESKASCGDCEACRSGVGGCRDPFIYSLRSVNEGPGTWGGLAEHMSLVAGSSVFRVPDHVSDEDATMFNPLGNAFYWVAEVGNVAPGDRVLILGAGQRGLCCAVAAQQQGAAQVIVTGLAQDAAKLALAPQFGATDCVIVDGGDTVDQVRELTASRGVDVVVDTVPVAFGPIADAVDCLRPGGRLVLAGVRTAEPGPFPLEKFRIKQLTMTGVSGTTRTAVESAMRTVASGAYPFHLMHSHVFGLAHSADAISLLGDPSRSTTLPIHIVVRPDSDARPE